jgi:hypothetical protein
MRLSARSLVVCRGGVALYGTPITADNAASTGDELIVGKNLENTLVEWVPEENIGNLPTENIPSTSSTHYVKYLAFMNADAIFAPDQVMLRSVDYVCW